MFRAFAMAIGVTLCILGGECLVVEKAILAKSKDPAITATAATDTLFQQPNVVDNPSLIEPPEWAPWSLLTGGAVTVLYSLTLRRKG